MKDGIEELIVPALTGKFGNWRYYQLILTVEQIAKNCGTQESPNYRIKSVEEVDEIYSKKGVSNLLQRAYDTRRLKPIKNYLLNQNDKYINNLTVGIFGGNPDWLNISLVASESSENLDELRKKIGFIKLSGKETIFVLDGQHRLKGLRKAYEENKSKIKDDEIVCTLIIHKSTNEGRIRTRRLFSTINRQAKPVSTGENILLDEDDVSAISVRHLIENYTQFKNKEVIALAKGGNISQGYLDKFTTVVTLWNINEKIIDHNSIYQKVEGKIIRIRPTDAVIKTQNAKVVKYWNKFFELLPEAKKFINDTKVNREKYRTGGGNFALRPIAQIAIFEIMSKAFENNQLDNIKKLPTKLSDKFWHYVLWDPIKNIMLTNRSLVKSYIKYNIALDLTATELTTLKTNYTKNSGEKEAKLAKPLV